jgi:hypothetical protein
MHKTGSIGKWHDLVNSTQYVDAFYKTKDGIKTEKYETLKRSVKKEREDLRKDIVTALRKLHT